MQRIIRANKREKYFQSQIAKSIDALDFDDTEDVIWQLDDKVIIIETKTRRHFGFLNWFKNLKERVKKKEKSLKIKCIPALFLREFHQKTIYVILEFEDFKQLIKADENG